MKKVLLIIALIVVLLFIVDKTILQDEEFVDQTEQVDQYEKLSNPESLPIGLKPENRAPSFSLTNLNGETVNIEDFKGKKVLLNFWATWCPPCKKEMPDMENLYKEYKDKDFVVLGINMTHTEKSEEVVSAFVKEYRLSFPILMDKNGEVSYQYELLSYPTTYFIDSDGVIRSKVVGELSKEHMYREMMKLP